MTLLLFLNIFEYSNKFLSVRVKLLCFTLNHMLSQGGAGEYASCRACSAKRISLHVVVHMIVYDK